MRLFLAGRCPMSNKYQPEVHDFDQDRGDYIHSDIIINELEYLIESNQKMSKHVGNMENGTDLIHQGWVECAECLLAYINRIITARNK